MSAVWLIICAFVGATLAAWVLLQGAGESSDRIRLGYIIGARRGPASWLIDLLTSLRGGTGAGVNTELSRLRFQLTGGKVDANRGIVSKMLVVAAKASPMSASRAQELNGWLSYLGSGLRAQEFGGDQNPLCRRCGAGVRLLGSSGGPGVSSGPGGSWRAGIFGTGAVAAIPYRDPA